MVCLRERDGSGGYLLFGLLTSLAYLTRPEGIGFLIVFGFWILIVNPSGGKRGWTQEVGIVFLAIFCFLLLSGPYLIQIRKETGRWGITKKFVNLDGVFFRGGGSPIDRGLHQKERDLSPFPREESTDCPEEDRGRFFQVSLQVSAGL